MYVTPETITPNYFQLRQLPYFKVDEHMLDFNLTSKRMVSVRNLTHKHPNIFAKVFCYWPKCIQRKQREETPFLKLIIIYELPVLSLEKLTNLLTQMHQKLIITQPQWNTLISQIENYKQKSVKLIDNIMMAEFQIKVSNKKNIMHHVYYCIHDNNFRLKSSFKIFNFQVSPYLGKAKFDLDSENDFIIKNDKVLEKLKQIMFQKLKQCYETNFDEEKSTKTKLKMAQFYQRDFKRMDESLLQLKLKYNYPLLRQKRFVPIQFIDGYDRSKLVDPIVSNKNKQCMFGHFTGYNSNNFSQLQNTHCQICGMEIKQIQQNKLLMFLRNNIYNPSNATILYCPQFNRFKIMKKCNEQQIINKKLEQLMISQDNSQQKEIQQQDMNSHKQMKEESVEQKSMKNQEEVVERQEHVITEIGFASFMHLCLNIKNMYSLTKTRLKMQAIKQLEYVDFVFNLSFYKNSTNMLQYFKQFELTDPARGKYCTHLQFADLRMYYKNAKKIINFYVGEQVYTCPICHADVKDCELMYLKQVLVLIKYIKRLIQPEVQDDILIKQTKKKKVDKNSIKILINNVQKKVYIQYFHSQSGQRKRERDQIQKFYATLVDPYIHFSQYSVGLHKKSKRIEVLYNFGMSQQSDQSQRFQKKWFGEDSNQFVI